MRRVATILGTAAVVMLTASVYAQAPDFSGTWTLDAEKTAAAAPAGAPAGGGGGRGGGGGGRAGGPMVLKQDAKVLTITRTMGENQVVTTYNLDGSPSKNAGRGQGGATEVTSTAKWDGAKLVVTSDNGQTVTYSMDGAWLVATTTRPGRDGGPATTTSVYYKKG
jgi:hypothetical protein